MVPQAAESKYYGVIKEECLLQKLSPYTWHWRRAEGKWRPLLFCCCEHQGQRWRPTRKAETFLSLPKWTILNQNKYPWDSPELITSGLTLDESCFVIVKIANKFSLQMVFVCLMTRAAVIDLIEERKKIRVQVWCPLGDSALQALRFFSSDVVQTWPSLSLPLMHTLEVS